MSIWAPWYKAIRKEKKPSGETWLISPPYTRLIDWEAWGRDRADRLATLLQVPVELMKANRVIVTIEAERNISSGPFQDKRRVLREETP